MTPDRVAQYLLDVKLEDLRRGRARASTIAGGTLGAAAVLSPFAIAFLFVMPHDEYDPARLLIVILAALFLVVGCVAWVVKRGWQHCIDAATAERIRAEHAARA